MKISELARTLGTMSEAVRFYEREGLVAGTGAAGERLPSRGAIGNTEPRIERGL